MAKDILMLPATNASTAEFRKWGGDFSLALDSYGLPKTPDTGQINWGSVNAPTSINAIMGYEMRRMDDSLQSTHPCFIKYEFGCSNPITIPAITISVGFATNGAGILTTAFSTSKQQKGTVASSVLQQCALSGATNRMNAGMFSSLDSGSFAFAVERTHNLDGTDNNTGILFYSTGSGTSSKENITLFYGSNIVQVDGTAMYVPALGSSGADGDILNFYPNLSYKNGTPLNPSFNTWCYLGTDRIPGSVTGIPVYGGTHYYYAMHPHSNAKNPSKINTANSQLLLLHE